MKSTVLSFVFLLIIITVNARGLERIINGEDTDLKPYFVRVTAKNDNEAKTGSGSMITAKHILTLATLIKGYSHWTIGYGSKTLYELTNIISRFGFIHPLYDATKSPTISDIGVIILPIAIDIPQLSPISLPDVIEPVPRINEEGTVVGFETFDVAGEPLLNATLKSAFLSVHPLSECTLTTNDTFCASNSYYQANVCFTDLGSAFAIHHRGSILFGGMLMSASNNCEISHKSNYLRIQPYVEWIKVVTNF